MKQIILVAGATGNLGSRIVKALVGRGAELRAVVRNSCDIGKINSLEARGVRVYKVNEWSLDELQNACQDVTCVVSALAGLKDVIIDAQSVLLDAAIAAGVPRFIPSDYSLDFTKFTDGENRNLDWRREFHSYLDQKPIAATSIFNGAFADMITGQMPVIFFKRKLVLYWGSSNYKWGFTTMDNTAEYTACVALDVASPRYLVIAGDQISAIGIRDVANEVLNEKFRLFRAGSQTLLGIFIKLARTFSSGKNELYPAWQGMQYMHNMIDARSEILQLDNSRYKVVQWTSIREVLEKHVASQEFVEN